MARSASEYGTYRSHIQGGECGAIQGPSLLLNHARGSVLVFILRSLRTHLSHLSDAYLGGLEFVGWCRDDFLGGGGSFLTGSSTMTICLAISESTSSSPEVQTHRYS